MGKESNIGWTDATWNPWRGCTKVSPGCAACYAETLSRRNPKTLGIWGPNGVRVVGSDSNRELPFRWDREAKAAGKAMRVFSLSLGDIWEDWKGPVHTTRGSRLYRVVDARDMANSVPMTLDDVRVWVLDTIRRTPNLTYLLLTKRPENWRRSLVAARDLVAAGYYRREGLQSWINDWLLGYPPANVWIGASVEDQARAFERIPPLLRIPAVVRFLSIEPLIGPIELLDAVPCGYYCDESAGHVDHGLSGIGWAIIGGESGPKRRPMDVEWVRAIHDRCREWGIPVFVKQDSGPRDGMQGRIPEDLWSAKEFPRVPAEAAP